MDILILGSTLLTELVVENIKKEHNLVGYVPSSRPTVKGKVRLPEASIDTECDIKLSIQYDKIVKETSDSFNLHTGLLPEYGGTNILDHAIKNGAKQQGLTFHQMTDRIDYGPIISKITYPIFEGDSAFDLFERVLKIGPDFTAASLKLLEKIGLKNVGMCEKHEPTIYKRGLFKADERILNYAR
tara:strand:+ start:679 stop:1233 length:555 start_codon:yes stop_codon:yes gene_type:complete